MMTGTRWQRLASWFDWYESVCICIIWCYFPRRVIL